MAAQPTRGHLVVVSNRLPVSVHTRRGQSKLERAPGGLVAALDPVVRERGGTWVGWPGGPLAAGDELDRVGRELGYRLVPVSLSQGELRRFYLGFANGTLWPLLHSFPTRMELEQTQWDTYEGVNRRFAAAASAAAEGGDLIWIHDYQLMRVAPHLRRERSDARIVFFLHVPFPAYDLFRILPWDRELLRGLLACDLVGFHCPGYAANFLDCAERLLGARVDREAGKVEHGERTVTVGAFPLGIDCDRYAKWASEAPPREPGDERIVLGVDRLDYTKGLPEKIRAFERLLELHPEHRERVVLLQIAEPSRDQVPEYQRLKRQVDELVGNVNGRFATSRWTPIRYLHRSIPPEELAGIYRDAQVALVTPLRDGMNLVAKEYVICQVDEPGVLVLSRLAGAAETMQEALRVNPYNTEQVAAALHQALGMDVSERTARMRALQRRERRSGVHTWVDTFLRTANAPLERIRPLEAADFARWLGAFCQGHPLELFLDYDGTLVEIAGHPSRVQMQPSLREALLACARRADTELAIVSGRALADLRRRIELPEAVLVGNHGLEIEGPGLEPFTHPDLPHFAKRLEELARELRAGCEPGVWLEEKGASLTLHYRDAAPALQPRIAERVREAVRRAGFQARDAICAVEARPPTGWDKGHAVLHLLRVRHGPAWSENVRVLYVGDDETDEDAFRALSGLGITFRVGRAERPTLASHRLPSLAAVETLLRWIAAR
jgi:trehalose 6-phosphate synthase/phosphatase